MTLLQTLDEKAKALEARIGAEEQKMLAELRALWEKLSAELSASSQAEAQPKPAPSATPAPVPGAAP